MFIPKERLQISHCSFTKLLTLSSQSFSFPPGHQGTDERILPTFLSSERQLTTKKVDCTIFIRAGFRISQTQTSNMPPLLINCVTLK